MALKLDKDSLPEKEKRRQERGYILGFEEGYRVGACNAIVKRALPFQPSQTWNRRILYVGSGKGMPYSPLDSAIIDIMRPLVLELKVTEPLDNVVAWVEITKPDLVLVLDGMLFPVEQIDAIRAKGVQTALWLTDDPYYTDVTVGFAPHYDHVFTLELNCVTFYKEHGCSNVHYLPLGVHPGWFCPRATNLMNRREICFVGSGYWKRVELFDQIAPYLKGRDVCISGLWWDRLKAYRLLKDKIRLNHWMGAEETAGFYNGTKIVINLHRSHDDGTFNYNSRLIKAVSPNPRTFEISACGVLQLTDVRDDLASFYKPGRDLATFGSAEELVEQIDYYLTHEEQHLQVALQGLRSTMEQHTFAHRLTQLFQTVFK
jgi:spore maturation protein CgeB